MPENSLYFDAITATRAMQADEQKLFEGTLTISAETQGELVENDISIFVQENFPQFIEAMRFLSKEDQEFLLSYYVLRKSQNVMAPIFQTTQTICSSRLQQAVQRLGAILMFGTPTVKLMAEILSAAGLEQIPMRELVNKYHKEITFSLALLIDAYAKVRNFQKVAKHYGLHRPAVRRAMVKACQQLKVSHDARQAALGAYIFGLVDKASHSGDGKSKRQLAKQVNVYKTDPAILGQFRVDCASPDFEHVFTSRACN